MKRITSFAIIVLVAGTTSGVRSAEDGISGLEACFRAARLSDVICSDATNPPEERLECFRKARSAQLECLEHVPLGVTGTTASSEARETEAAPKSATRGLEIGSTPAQKADKVDRLATAPIEPIETSPVVVAPVAPDPAPIAPPSISAPPSLSVPPSVSGTTGNTAPKPSSSSWIVSETTSPIDYSPVVIATMRSASDDKGSPAALAIMCRRLRAEISLRTDGTWRPQKNSKVQVAFQINDQPVSSAWNLSADGKTATNSDSAVELLQSLREGAPLKVIVSDGADHAATFQLAGLDLVRRKISAACKLTPPVPENKLSLDKR